MGYNINRGMHPGTSMIPRGVLMGTAGRPKRTARDQERYDAWKAKQPEKEEQARRDHKKPRGKNYYRLF